MAVSIDFQSWRTRFAIPVIVAFLFSFIALFTGGWGDIKYEVAGKTVWSYDFGILTGRCPDVDGWTYGCWPRYPFEKWCCAAMFLTIFAQIAIIIDIVLSYTNLKLNINRKELILLILSGVATFLLLTVVIIYPVKAHSIYQNFLVEESGIGFGIAYSYILAVIGFICMVAATICGYFMFRGSS